MGIPRVIALACFALAIAQVLDGCAGRTGVRPGEDTGVPPIRGLKWPLAGKQGSGFGQRAGGNHAGLDILAPKGAEVLAAGDGTVVYAGDSLRGYGNAAVIDHGSGITTLYGHLMEICVKSGDIVRQGAAIGKVGKTGNATTWHLHFEIRAGGVPIDPENHLPGKVDTR